MELVQFQRFSIRISRILGAHQYDNIRIRRVNIIVSARGNHIQLRSFRIKSLFTYPIIVLLFITIYMTVQNVVNIISKCAT